MQTEVVTGAYTFRELKANLNEKFGNIHRSTVYRWLGDAFIGIKKGRGYTEEDLETLKSLGTWYHFGGTRKEFRAKLIAAKREKLCT